MAAHEIYHVIVNLSLAGQTEKTPEDASAEERVRQIVEARLEGPGITASRISVYRGFENASDAVPADLLSGKKSAPRGALERGANHETSQETPERARKAARR